ncbi:hypothetical protein [Phenylobacterium sp.]|uniref:hypothetical protein n=1 Tax=Phenylobacterium sp. TaxID=1871053 RepID=UPI002732C4C6|nr:hypothetical protein [Phenylobacterium sp.]MDP3853513.1 hypothetical protein [Phenylobacterium sp.]
MKDKVQELFTESKLNAAIAAGDIEIEPTPGGNPFRPSYRVYLRKGNELDSLGGGSMDRLNKLWRKTREKKFKENIKDPNKTRIVAIGDSWFHYPFGSDMLEWFVDQYAVKTLAAAGDVLSRMAAAREYEPYIAEIKPHFFLLSGGGNDLLGEAPNGERNIKRMLIDFDSTKSDWLTPVGRQTIADTVGHYETIRADLASLGFNGRLVVHGYDYASPASRGPWLSEPLEDKGYLSDAVQVAAITQLVDAFRAAIAAWAAQHKASVIHADCVGLNGRGPQWWFDEIHPTMRAYRYRYLPAFRTPMDAASAG